MDLYKNFQGLMAFTYGSSSITDPVHLCLFRVVVEATPTKRVDPDGDKNLLCLIPKVTL